MRVYTVQIDPLSAEDDRGAVLIREGFSWPAALFTVFWALYHRLWGGALLLAGLVGGLSAALALVGLDPLGEAAVEAAYFLLVGFSANDWRRRALARRGYLLAGVVVERNLDAAERGYFTRLAMTAA